MAQGNELELLYQAAGTTLGIVISVSDFEKARQKLYQAKVKAADPELNCLQFRRSPFEPETELWIVKGGTSIPKEGEST